MDKWPSQDEWERLGREVLAGPLAELDPRESGREMIAAMRCGDEPAAELVLNRYLASVPLAVLPAMTDKLGFLALALRDLALKLAQAAAEDAAGPGRHTY